MKATVSKQTAEGEMIVLEIEGKNADDLGPRLADALSLTDARLLQMNHRIMDSHTYVKSLDPAVRGHVQLAVNSAIEP